MFDFRGLPEIVARKLNVLNLAIRYLHVARFHSWLVQSKARLGSFIQITIAYHKYYTTTNDTDKETYII